MLRPVYASHFIDESVIAVVCSFVALQYVSPGALQCLCSVLID